jgi:LysM repeat protein
MNIVKILGIAIAIHGAAYLLIAQPGCRSTASHPAPSSTASQSQTEAPAPAPVLAVAPAPEVSLNLPFAQVGEQAGERFAPTRPGAEPTATPPPQTKTYVVKKGDSLALIARKNGITVAELKAANNLQASASVKPGQKLIIPSKTATETGASKATATSPAGTYTVKSGDTISKIASRHRTTSAAIRAANNLSGDHLKIGQVLQIPGGATRSQPSAGTPAATPSAPVAAPTSNLATSKQTGSKSPAGVHTVGQGESAESIAKRYGISVGELVRANQITDPRKIRIGQVLTIPGPAAAKAAHPAPSLVPESAVEPATSYQQPAAVPSLAPAVPAVEPVDAPVIPIDEPAPVQPAN